MEHKTRTKALSWLLSLALMLSLVPGMSITALAEETTDKTVAGLGTSAIGNPTSTESTATAWAGSYVYYGKYDGTTPTKYRVLDKASNDFGVSGGSLLLDCNTVLYSTAFGSSNAWASSSLRSGLQGDAFLSKEGVFTDQEKAAIAESTKSEAVTEDGSSAPNNIGYYSYVALDNDTVFVLDAKEVSRASYGYASSGTRKKNGEARNRWWLRSVYTPKSNKEGSSVSEYGGLYDYTLSGSWGVCPAFNVSLSSVIFSSEIPDESGSYKLTLKDDALGIAVTDAKKVEKSGNTLTIPYTVSGDNSANATQVSVLVTDKAYTDAEAQILKYGKLADVTDASLSGKAKFTLPEDLTGTLGTNYHIYLLAEDVNGEKETDYAGLKEITADDVTAHTHSFTYTADGDTITATCGEGCDITEGLTLTISAPTGELTADGSKTFPATLNDDYNATAFPEGSISEISYTKDGVDFTGTPTEAGTYTASVTVGEGQGAATASVGYTVNEAQTQTHTHDGISFQPWTSTDSLPTESGSYYLTQNVTLSETWTVPGTNNLCLNGHSINGPTNASSVFNVNTNTTLNLYDCGVTAGAIIARYKNGVAVAPGSTFNLYGGKITSNTDNQAIGVENFGTFNMYGGEISGNKGTGVSNVDGTFTMTGGTIRDNGKGVANQDIFKLSGNPTITNNKSGTGDSAKDNNVSLANNKVITIDGVLSNTTPIGVTMSMSAPGVFTSGWNEKMSDKTPTDYFTSDDSAYTVQVDGNELKLAVIKTNPTVTAPTAKSLTYTGSAQELVNAGSTNDGTLYYAVTTENTAPTDENLYTTSIPAKTEAGTYYVWYKVVGDANHNDTDAACVTVTVSAKQTQTVTAADVTATYGDTGKAVSGTTTGDGAISYAVKSGDAVTVDASGNLTILKAGTAVVTVTAAETDTYAEATKDVTVTVNTKAMTVSAEDVTETVDGQPHGITVTVTDPASGYTVKYGTEAGTYNETTSPTQTEVGELTVYYQVTADNYTTYTGSATVTVSDKSVQTITAADVTATYGDTGKAVSGTTTGDGAISYAVKSGDAVTVDASTGALTIVKAGTATVTVTAAETATYAAATKDVTVTVNRKAVTVTADDKTMTAGETAPELTKTVTGLVGSDQPGVLTVDIQCEYDNNTAGTYPIVVSGEAEQGNYAVTYVNGTLTINAAPVYYDDTPSTPTTPTTPTETVTIPVSGDEESVNVTVEVKDDTATVTGADVEKVLEAEEVGTVSIDVSSLDEKVTGVVIPGEMVDKIADAVADEENTADGMEVKLPGGTVSFDAEAVAAIAEKTDGKDLTLNLDNLKVTELTSSQQEAVSELEVEVVLDAYMTSGGERISDFQGGSATVKIPYTLKDGQVPAGIVVWYVAEDGTRTQVPATYDGENIVFNVPHFSNYVIAYDAEKAKECPKDSTCPMSAFTDLDPTLWYHDGIHFCLENGMMNGVGNGKFDPTGATSRAMIVTILYRMENEPKVTGENPFTDVEDGKWYTNAVLWAAENKIVEGYGNGKFKPNDDITREQLATILYRYAQSKGQGFTGAWMFLLDYPDASEISSWADEAMHWCVMNEIINGKDGKLVPGGDASRAEAATMLMRYCTKISEAE